MIYIETMKEGYINYIGVIVVCEHGIEGRCQKCYHKQYYQKNKAKRDRQIKNWKKANPDKMRKIYDKSRAGRGYSEAQRAASNRGLCFTLSEERYEQLVSGVCYYCAAPLGSTGMRLDRIDNKQGYTEENVLPCCGRCNLLRCDKLTVEEMKVGMEALLEHWRLQHAKDSSM